MLLHAHPIFFLTVCRKMLQIRQNAGALNAFCHGCRHHTGEIRILGIALRQAPAQGIPVDVHAGAENHIDPLASELTGNDAAVLFHKLRVPGAGQGNRRRIAAVFLSLRLDAGFCTLNHHFFQRVQRDEQAAHIAVLFPIQRLPRRFRFRSQFSVQGLADKLS